MSKKITLGDLLRIFDESVFPKELNKKIIMKHFEVGENRIIGKKTIDKIKQVLMLAIEAARLEQFKDKGGVIANPDVRLSSTIKANEEILGSKAEKKVEDKYGLESIQSGIVSQRLDKSIDSTPQTSDAKKLEITFKLKPEFDDEKKPVLPSIEDLTVLSGGKLQRNDIDNKDSKDLVQREIAIRNYSIKDESRSSRWGKESIMNRKGDLQEINHPAYIFHSDLWQIESARETNVQNQCDIFRHTILDMVANNINVVMLENETEPFFVIEGYGLLHSKDSLKDKVCIQELIQVMIISCEVWQIALKRPESLLRGQDVYGKEKKHQIDMTSVIPLADIRTKFVNIDNKFKANYSNPNNILKKTIRELQNHRKNIIWTCGAPIIDTLRATIRKHRSLIDLAKHELNIVVVGASHTFHPIKIKYRMPDKLDFQELLPNYCKKHSTLSENSLKNIFGSIPAIYNTKGNPDLELPKIAHAVHQRLGYSAIETQFDPGYIRGNPSEILPISNLDIILPPIDLDMQKKLQSKGFKIE